MDNDNIWSGFFVAMILFGFFVWMLSRVATKVLVELGLMFDAFGAATASFLALAWAALKVVAALSAIIVVIYAAYQQYRLTKNTVDILADVDTQLNKWADDIGRSQKDFESRVSRQVQFLHRELKEALTEPEAVPKSPDTLIDVEAVAHSADRPVFVVSTALSALPPSEQQDATSVDTTQPNESATTPSISNPY